MSARFHGRHDDTPGSRIVSAPEESSGMMRATREKGKKESLGLTCLFGAYVFLQFTVLGLANHAGESYLTTSQRDKVYFALQIFVIFGYILYSLFFRFCVGKRSQNTLAYGVFGLSLVCGVLLFASDRASLLNVIVSMLAALCLGGIGGAAHRRMSLHTVTGADTALCMGFGSAAAVVLQYLLQFQWGVSPLLPVFMLAAFLLFVYLLLCPAPQADMEDGHRPKPAPPRRIAVCVVIAATFILFACFYNETIHHRMIQSDYTSYNVYSWPRLMLVPGYLFFALIGDRRDGKYVPVASLCIMLITLLTVVLARSPEAYWLNMCLFYFSIAACTSYYLLTFWRLAPGTHRPAFWAPFGRMLDSAMVLFTSAVNLSELSAPVVLGMDIAGVAAVILLMVIGGDFNLTEAPTVPEIAPAAPELPPMLSPEETLERMRERYDLTRREAEVLRELVCTEDKQTAISERLIIKVKTLQDYVTRLYRKTGASTRVGLSELYHENQHRV